MTEVKGTKITGVGAYLPPKILTNADLEKMVETTDEWIQTRTGIRERRVVENGTTTSDLATKACEEAIQHAGLTIDDIDLIIVATITPDMLFPSTACIVQQKLGAKAIPAFDISAACSGFPYALTVADGMIRSGQYRNILVVGAEALSSFIDWTDRSTCVLFGDGAGACVLSASDDPERGVVSSYMGSDGSCVDILKIPAGGSQMPPSVETVQNRMHTVKMQGAEVFKLAVRTMCEAIDEVSKRAGIDVADVDFLIPHQANMRILQAVADRAKIDMEKVYINLDRYGNMSAASTPVALCEAVREGKIKPGSNVVLVAFGAGLTWAASCVKW